MDRSSCAVQCCALRPCVLQVPSASDIKGKLTSPLGALPNPAKDLANKAKTKTPSAGVLKSKAKAKVIHRPDLNSGGGLDLRFDALW